MKKILIALTACVFTCLFFKDSFAALPAIPSGQDLDAQAERFRQEYSIEKKAREQSIQKALIQAEENEKAPAAPGTSFVLSAVKLTGTTIFDPERLSFVWKPYLGREINFKDLRNIVRLVKRVYKDLGYLTTTAYLPPQDIKDGIVEIHVVEGKLGHISVDGNKYFSTPSIEKYFHTYQGEVLDMGEIERDLMRLNDNRDMNVSSVLSPGEDPGTVDVTLKEKEFFPYHVSVGTDNQGSRLTGRFRRLVSLNTTNLTGNEDSLSFNGAYTDLSQGDYLSYQTPVGSYGTKVGVDAGYFQGKLGQEFKPFDVVNYTEFYNPNATFELYEAEDAQVNLRTGTQIKYSNKRQATDKLTSEHLTLPYAALDMIKTDSMGQTTFSPELSSSAPGFLGASRKDNERSSRPGVDGFFTKYDHYIIRNQRMPWGSYMQIKSQFQAASHTLPTSEQLQLGGEGSVRGYPEGDYLADIGGDLDADWYFPSYFIPSSWEFFDVSLKDAIEPFIFYDMGGGQLYRIDNVGEHRTNFLSSVGFGFKIQIRKNMYLRMEWAVPTGDKPVKGTGPSTFDVSFQAGT